LEWAVSATESGIGEILLNSIDRDGTQAGYDLELIKKVSDLVNVPVIASGGAGTLDQISEAVLQGGADAVLLASLLHYKAFTIADIKKHLLEKGVIVR
jgi:cyclase